VCGFPAFAESLWCCRSERVVDPRARCFRASTCGMQSLTTASTWLRSLSSSSNVPLRHSRAIWDRPSSAPGRNVKGHTQGGGRNIEVWNPGGAFNGVASRRRDDDEDESGEEGWRKHRENCTTPVFLKIEFESGESLLQSGIGMDLVVLHSRMRSASRQRNPSPSPPPRTAVSSLRSSCPCLI
jgi:hypothetical protein